MAAPGQMPPDRVVADTQNGRHALARGHQIGVRHAQPGPAGSVQRCRHFGLHGKVPVAIARREPPGQILSLLRRPLAQLCLGGIGSLLGQRAAQCIGCNACSNVTHTGPADLCIQTRPQCDSQQHSLRASFQMPHHAPAAEDDPNAAMPVTGARNGMELSELRGARYDDPRWEPLLDQLSISDMDRLTARAGYQTPAISSVGKPAAVDADGPSSVYSNFSGQSSVAFPSAVMLANTWNKALAFDYGSCMAKMASELGISGWYAPALNIHRSAFGGRAFEYYSEDSLLTGKLAAQVVRAAKEGGVYTFLKHFALNEQETRRCDMLCTWADEQAIREIYLRPFELAVKEGGATAVMSSFNYIGTVYAGGCPALLKNVLRNEWGFRGMVITDTFKNTTFQNGDQLIRSGNDACLVAYENPDAHLKVRSASGVLALRTASKNILYTVVNSNACTPGAKNQTPGWKFLLFAADTAGVVCLAFCEYWSVKNYRKRNAAARD